MTRLRELSEVREEAARFAAAQAADARRRLSGLPSVQTVAARAKGAPRLGSREGLQEVCEALQRAQEKAQEDDGPRESAARVARLSSLAGLLVQARAQALEPGAFEELLQWAQRPSVRVPGDAGLHGALPPRLVERQLPLEVARDKRAELEAALAEASAHTREARSAAWEATLTALDETHRGEPLAASLALQEPGWAAVPEGQTAASEVARACERVLSATGPLTQDLFAWLLERHTRARAFPGGAERHDVLHLLGAPRCAGAFPRGELVRTVRRFAEAWRLDLTADRCVKLDERDESERPLHALFAAAVPVDPPDEVRILLVPAEGPRALAALLGAVSESQRLAGAPGDAPPEDLWLCDPALPFATAALLSPLARDPRFLRRVAKTDLGRDDERALVIADVIHARLLCARVLASLEALSSGLSARAEVLHRDLHTRAALATLPSGLALEGLDALLSPWAELRGLCFAARARASLRERFDEDWWRNPRALSALRSLWSRGGRPTLRELWTELAPGEAPSEDALLADLFESCR